MTVRETYFGVSTIPFWIMHLTCFSVFFIDFQWWYIALAFGSYYLRMFFVTGGYHRYFSHKTYSTSRVFQFIIAFCAQTTSQKGALWWAAHHRHHHKYSDQDEDIHSAKESFWYAHIGWILSPENNETEYPYIRDLTRFKELVWLNEHPYLPVVVYAVAMFLLFDIPGLVYGFVVATVMLWHGTFTINSLSHTWGWQRYWTDDTSRNNPILAIVTLGEGWHNNHHKFQASARNGFFWWEYDITYYLLKLLSFVGLVWDLRPVPKYLLDSNHESWIKKQTKTEATDLSVNTEAAVKGKVAGVVQNATSTAQDFATAAREIAQETVHDISKQAEAMKVVAAERTQELAQKAEEIRTIAAEKAETIATTVEDTVRTMASKEKLA